jgi:hypothetical protein
MHGDANQPEVKPDAEPFAGGHHDADDEGSLEDLAEDDDGRGEHVRFPDYFTMMWPRAVLGLKSPKNS